MTEMKDKDNRYFHVTPIENLESILQNGLLPMLGERSIDCNENKKAIYLFHSIADMDNALLNWLGECFPEDIDLAILQIDVPDGFSVITEKDSNGDDFFESVCLEPIPVDYISAIYDETYQKIENENKEMERD